MNICLWGEQDRKRTKRAQAPGEFPATLKYALIPTLRQMHCRLFIHYSSKFCTQQRSRLTSKRRNFPANEVSLQWLWYILNRQLLSPFSSSDGVLSILFITDLHIRTTFTRCATTPSEINNESSGCPTCDWFQKRYVPRILGCSVSYVFMAPDPNNHILHLF